ncbi:MAG: LLM class flavin-dependent oxidoreductase [Pseudomonadota bacterium]
MSAQPKLGLFLNMGRQLGATAADVFDLTLEQVDRAEAAGFHDLWFSEHHFIPFGINPSALTACAFALGRTRRVRVGTAVTLSPLYHPLELAERAALLDQFSGGRFDLGIGRGGYLKDFEMLDRDPSRWDAEPNASADIIMDAWRGGDLAAANHDSGPSLLQPPPLSRPAPPLFVATRSPAGIEYAARNGLPVQHYFASPTSARVQLEQAYRETNAEPVEHLHLVLLSIERTEARARERLKASLARSFADGDWPHVPQVSKRRAESSDKPPPRDAMAQGAAAAALAGPIESVRDQLAAFVEATGATRVALFAEAVAERDDTLAALDAVAHEFL